MTTRTGLTYRLTLQTRSGPVVLAVDERGAGPTVILLHPNPGNRHDYDAIWPMLTRSFRTIRFDWPGYGESPEAPENASAVGFCEVLEQFIGTLSLERVSLVGNSVGGFAAAVFAAKHPERVDALVLVAPGGFTAANPFTRTFCRLIGSRLLGPIAMRRLPRRYLRVTNQWTSAIRARAEAGSRREWELATFRSLWQSFAEKEHDLRSVASQIRTPTLLVWGKRDPVLRWRGDGRRAARLLETTIATEPVVMPAGHQPYAELPDRFLDAVLPFLTRHTDASPGEHQ
jgi:pimeloyl-ACP methyl ester carboxylesterase